MSQETMDGNNPINWQDLNLVDNKASVEATQALWFLIQRVHQAQQNLLLWPTLQSLFIAHDLVLYDADMQNQVPTLNEAAKEDQHDLWTLQMNVLIFCQGHHVNLWNDLHNLWMIEFHQGDNVLNHKSSNNLLPILHHLHKARHKEGVMKEEGRTKREDDLHLH